MEIAWQRQFCGFPNYLQIPPNKQTIQSMKEKEVWKCSSLKIFEEKMKTKIFLQKFQYLLIKHNWFLPYKGVTKNYTIETIFNKFLWRKKNFFFRNYQIFEHRFAFRLKITMWKWFENETKIIMVWRCEKRHKNWWWDILFFWYLTWFWFSLLFIYEWL